MSVLYRKLLSLLIIAAFLFSSIGAVTPVLASPSAQSGGGAGQSLWQPASAARMLARSRLQPAFGLRQFAGYSLDQAGMTALLAAAPMETLGARGPAFQLALPTPDGDFKTFAVVESPVMEPGLAALHPDIKTYRGVGVDDPAATIRFDVTPLGFHASVRAPLGAWYIDPYYENSTSLYASYYGRDLTENRHGAFFHPDGQGPEVAAERATYHAADTVAISGSGFAPNTAITITIYSPDESFADRTLNAASNELGAFETSFIADPDGHLDTHIIEASDGSDSGFASYQVIRDDDPTVDPPTGDVLRVYRLALITDPGYAAYFGGSANVTPAKVTLINRVNQLYEDDMSIRMLLVANNDLLNLDTWAQAVGPNGPCGAAGCFTQSQVTGCSSTTRARYVIGQIIGASNYDIGHLALGQPGGGVANLGVIGRSNKAGGCTGIPTPVGDFYAVDYVAHEMGHQFSGNHPFNGNQLNCSGGNRSAATSVEPGSGSSVMAYAGICLTDDLQAHSDPYFSQRSQQEISTYTSSNQAAINEVQTISLRHFGGGNEVQVVTFGPGYSQASTVQPLSVAINAAPSATSRGGAEERGNTVTIATGSAHTLQVGDVVTIAGVAEAGYNGTWTVTAVPTTRSFQFENPTTGLSVSGGGTITLVVPGASQAGTTVTISTSAPHNRAVGDIVTISGVGVGGYNGTYTITSVPTPRTFTYEAAASGLASSGGGSATFFSPFQLRFNGVDTAVIGGAGQAYNAANIQAALNALPDIAGAAVVSGVSATGFTVTFSLAPLAGADVAGLELVGLSCNSCFASVEETNHGGAFDAFTLNYNGAVSAPIVNGTNYSAAGILAALTPILPAGATATVAGFGASTFNNTGFQVTFTGALAATNVPVLLQVQDFTPGASGFTGETDKGGPVDNKGGSILPTGNTWPAVTVPAQYTIPLRTPFSLTGSAVDAEGDAMVFSWEQNDRGGTAGTSLLNNTKTNGPLFAMFPKSGQISLADALLYDSPGQNHLTGNPTRVFPDLQQILDNNTNAETGACPAGPIAAPVPVPVVECFAEFLPTADYVGFTNVNASPLSLHFRFTARDLHGGSSSADTTLLLASGTGPFLVTSPNTATAYVGGSQQAVTWNPAGTDQAPISASQVKISLSVDGGYTYPYVLAEATANDGSEAVTLPNVATTKARVKIEAVGNIFFDLSNVDFTIQATPAASNSLDGGSQSLQYSDGVSPAVTISATDPDSFGAALSASAAGLPAGLSLALSSASGADVLPGTSAWTVSGATSAAPGTYPVTVTVSDDTGGSATTGFTLVVAPENAEATYTGDMVIFTAANASTAGATLRVNLRDSAIVAGSGDTLPGDIRNATVTFKEGATTLCGPVPAELINGALTTGTAACAATLGLGEHQVDVYVNNYYTALTSALVEVSQPTGRSVTAGGFLLMKNPGGSYSADAGTKMNFGISLNFKDQKNLKGLQGNATIIFRKGGHEYRIKSTTLNSLGITLKTPAGKTCSGPASPTCFGLADFRAKASLTDITNPAAPVTLYNNLTLQITMTDKGEPGSADTIGVTLWNGSKLLFSSEWSGSKTLEMLLAGGNIVVH